MSRMLFFVYFIQAQLTDPKTMNVMAGSIARSVVLDYYSNPGPSDALATEDNLCHVATYCRRKHAPPEPTPLDFLEFEPDAQYLPEGYLQRDVTV